RIAVSEPLGVRAATLPSAVRASGGRRPPGEVGFTLPITTQSVAGSVATCKHAPHFFPPKASIPARIFGLGPSVPRTHPAFWVGGAGRWAGTAAGIHPLGVKRAVVAAALLQG